MTIEITKSDQEGGAVVGTLFVDTTRRCPDALSNARFLKVISVDNLKSAERVLKGARVPQLLIMNSNLRDGSDLQLLATLKKSDAYASIPLILISASPRKSHVRQAYALGINCFIGRPTGPVAWQEMVAAIERFWVRTAKIPEPL